MGYILYSGIKYFLASLYVSFLCILTKKYIFHFSRELENLKILKRAQNANQSEFLILTHSESFEKCLNSDFISRLLEIDIWQKDYFLSLRSVDQVVRPSPAGHYRPVCSRNRLTGWETLSVLIGLLSVVKNR